MIIPTGEMLREEPLLRTLPLGHGLYIIINCAIGSGRDYEHKGPSATPTRGKKHGILRVHFILYIAVGFWEPVRLKLVNLVLILLTNKRQLI
jgi:hypothetical protein